MISHELTRELINEIRKLVLHAEEDSINYSVLEHARKLAFHADIERDKFPTEDEVKADIKEIAHYFGGWTELRKVIEQLEENDN